MNGYSKLIAILVAVCAVLQVMIAPYIAISGVSPNFMLLGAVCAGILCGPRRGCAIGFLCGLLFDLSTTGPIGAMAFILTVVGYLMGVFAADLLQQNWFMPVFALFIAAFVTELLRVIVLALFGQVAFLSGLVHVVFPGTLYDAVFGFLCFPLLRSRLMMSTSMKVASKSTSGMHVKNINLR